MPKRRWPACSPANRSTRPQAERLFEALVAGRLDEPAIAALLIALKIKGETTDELIGAARALRAADAPFERPDYLFADSCGTGGDGSGTINLSTAVAFVAAAAGLPVAKHGNRSVTSRCGSADVLEHLGVKLDVLGRDVAAGARRDRALLPVRARLSSRPQTCRAGAARAQGAHDHEHPRPLREPGRAAGAAARRRRGAAARAGGARRWRRSASKRALVVHGGGLDEVALHGETEAVRLTDGTLERLTIAPEDAGFERRAAGDDPAAAGRRRMPSG